MSDLKEGLEPFKPDGSPGAELVWTANTCICVGPSDSFGDKIRVVCPHMMPRDVGLAAICNRVMKGGNHLSLKRRERIFSRGRLKICCSEKKKIRRIKIIMVFQCSNKLNTNISNQFLLQTATLRHIRHKRRILPPFASLADRKGQGLS